jgi:hypothetical protein
MPSAVADVYLSPFQIVALCYWYVRGHKEFRGPCPNLMGAERAEVHPVTDEVREEIAMAGREAPAEKAGLPPLAYNGSVH